MNKKLKLRIFIYGKEALNDIHKINSTLQPKIEGDIKYKIKPHIGIDKESKWEYFIFQSEINEDSNVTIKNYLEEHYLADNMIKANDEIKKIIKEHSNDKNNEKLNEEISNILLEYRQFYDVLVISVNNLLDEDSQLAFKYFQGFSDKRGQQPFLLFLTKKDDNPKASNLFQFVENEFFDKRNVYAFKYPKNDKDIEKINKFFFKCANYYHEEGNVDFDSPSQSFNILICGQAGVGKSSFINQFLQEKTAKEGEGLSVTHEVTCYIHPKYPIKIYDTPGFEDDDTVKIVRKTLENFEDNMKITKDHLDLILYFCELKNRNFLNLEMELIKNLIKNNKRIIFVLNDFKNNKKKEINKLTETMKDSLKKIITSISQNERENIDQNEILNNIVVINLRQSLFEYEDENEEIKVVLKQCYGMDTLFKKIYDLFSNDKISIYQIQNADNVKELQEEIKKYKLLNFIRKIEDMYISIKINSSKTILSFSKYDCFVWIFRDSRRKDLLKKINNLNKGPIINNYDKKLIEIKMKIDELKAEDKEKIIKDFFESIKRFKEPFKIAGFDFNAYWYNEYTLLIGAIFLKEFEIDYGEYDEKCKNYIKQLSESLNKAIDGFQDLSKEWEETYASLKAHKSDKEWVNRYFLMNLPKNK